MRANSRNLVKIVVVVCDDEASEVHTSLLPTPSSLPLLMWAGATQKSGNILEKKLFLSTMAMEEEVEDSAITVGGEPENLAVFLGHNLTPPLVEATIMVI